MRARLLRGTLTISLLAVISLGVPLLLLARHQVWSSARDTLRQQATSIAAGLEDRLDADQPVDLVRYGEALRDRRIVVTSRRGVQQVAGARLTGPVMQASVQVGGSTVSVAAEQHPTAVRAREVTLLVAGVALLAVGLALGLAVRQARRLSAPLSVLADQADALGRGEAAPAPALTGIVELDRTAQVLERSSLQIRTTIALQREFASDAAHQLRTPLTGIGLRLEELTRLGDAAARQEAEDGLAQVERLDRVITALLARARGDAADPTRLDLTALVADEAAAWRPAVETAGRGLDLDLSPAVHVRARPDHLAAILSCLLDNALQHGAGRIAVTTRPVGGQVLLEVTDDGPGVPAELADRVFERNVSGNRGTGIGLALARSLAAAEAGRLELVPPGRSRFRLTLPLDS